MKLTGSISLAVGTLSLFLGFSKPVSAVPLLPGQERVTYQASPIIDNDVINFCQTKKQWNEEYVGFKRAGDAINCLYDLKNKSRIEDVGITLARARGEGYSIGLEFHSSRSDEATIVPVRRQFSAGNVCEYKHPGKGTWAARGGTACDDSYIRFKSPF